MAQVKSQTLTEQWVALEDIEQPEADKLYYIQNRGNGVLLVCEGSQEPTTLDGIIVPAGKMIKYKLGSQDLYLRALVGSCLVNVSNED